MTIQLNPTTADAYEQKTLSDIRQRVFNALGFLSGATGQPTITNATENLGTMRTYIFNMIGMAAMAAFPPPGVLSMLNGFINMAQQTAFRRLEISSLVSGAPPTLTNDTDPIVVDPSVVRMLALAQAKAHYGQEDAAIYLKQAEQYFGQVAMRVPPNALPAVTRIVSDAQFELFRRYDLFRNERWFTWTFVAGQRFYSISGNDERSPIPTPTGVTVTIGSATTAGMLSVPRYNATALQLAGGNAIIFGGTQATGDNATADVFDSKSMTFSSVAMNHARAAPMAIRLSTGDLLVTGGFNGSPLVSAEIYDPAANIFVSLSATMVDAHFEGNIAILANGKVLIAGGQGLSGFIATAELFDPSTNLFTATGAMTGTRSQATAVTLSNGFVLIAGGSYNGLPSNANKAELYNPATGTFSATGNMTVARVLASACLIANGKALVTGGVNSIFTPLATAETFDPNTGTFTATTGAMGAARSGHTMTLLGNGKVLIAGGSNASIAISSAELFDPVTGLFTATGAMTSARAFHTATKLTDGTVLIAGGSDNSNTYLSSAEIYDPNTGIFTKIDGKIPGTPFYRVAAFTAVGTTLASPEVSVIGVPSDTAVTIAWNAVSSVALAGYHIYGRTSNAEQLLATVGPTVNSYTDNGTITPSGALPTINTTGNSGPIIDQRKIAYVGISRGDVGWRELSKGVPPPYYSNQTNGIPEFYDIREAIEVWPPPYDASWQLRMKGHYVLAPFEADGDFTSLDWQAVYLQAVADAKVTFKQPDKDLWQAKLAVYIGDLIAGQHGTAHYVPGFTPKRNAVLPVLLNSDGNPI